VKVTFIGHASLLSETKGISILSDPWWRGPCFGAQWWNRPEPNLSALRQPPDYVYISHGHHDHFHPGTLKSLEAGSKVLVSKHIGLSRPIADLGFEVVEVDKDAPVTLANNVEVWIWPTYGGDTLFVQREGDEILINLNDALHSAPRSVQDLHLNKLKALFPHIDYVFCGYGIASHFPNCYFIPGKNDRETAARRQAYFNRQWAYINHELQPEFAFPFAANVVFFEDDLVNLNEAVHNSERPVDAYRSAYGEPGFELVDIAPGFSIESGQVVIDERFSPISMTELLANDPEAHERANKYFAPDGAQLETIRQALVDNLEWCREYLLEFRGDYTFVIELRGSSRSFAIKKRGAQLTLEMEDLSSAFAMTPDVVFTTRAIYLRRSLQEPFGHEVLFVGSGGVFHYRDRQDADGNLHRELAVVLRKHTTKPASRFGDNPEWLFHLKRAVKGLLGRTEPDLYDLKTWVVFDEPEATDSHERPGRRGKA